MRAFALRPPARPNRHRPAPSSFQRPHTPETPHPLSQADNSRRRTTRLTAALTAWPSVGLTERDRAHVSDNPDTSDGPDRAVIDSEWPPCAPALSPAALRTPPTALALCLSPLHPPPSRPCSSDAPPPRLFTLEPPHQPARILRQASPSTVARPPRRASPCIRGLHGHSLGLPVRLDTPPTTRPHRVKTRLGSGEGGPNARIVAWAATYKKEEVPVR